LHTHGRGRKVRVSFVGTSHFQAANFGVPIEAVLHLIGDDPEPLRCCGPEAGRVLQKAERGRGEDVRLAVLAGAQRLPVVSGGERQRPQQQQRELHSCMQGFPTPLLTTAPSKTANSGAVCFRGRRTHPKLGSVRHLLGQLSLMLLLGDPCKHSQGAGRCLPQSAALRIAALAGQKGTLAACQPTGRGPPQSRRLSPSQLPKPRGVFLVRASRRFETTRCATCKTKETFWVSEKEGFLCFFVVKGGCPTPWIRLFSHYFESKIIFQVKHNAYQVITNSSFILNPSQDHCTLKIPLNKLYLSNHILLLGPLKVWGKV